MEFLVDILPDGPYNRAIDIGRLTSYVRIRRKRKETVVKEPRLAQSVAEEVRSTIVRNRMSAGDKLPTESELMARFEVGRSTIREAMKQLQAENIVEIRHGKGSFVADNTGVGKDPLGLGFEEQSRVLRELMEVRLLLEPGIAGEAARRRTQEDIETMQREISSMAEACAAGEDYERFDYGFHIAMAESMHNSVLRRIYPVFFEAIEQGYRRTQHVHGSFQVALNYHREILSAIEEGSAEAAFDATKRHILQALADINRNVEGDNQQ